MRGNILVAVVRIIMAGRARFGDIFAQFRIVFLLREHEERRVEGERIIAHRDGFYPFALARDVGRHARFLLVTHRFERAVTVFFFQFATLETSSGSR